MLNVLYPLKAVHDEFEQRKLHKLHCVGVPTYRETNVSGILYTILRNSYIILCNSYTNKQHSTETQKLKLYAVACVSMTYVNIGIYIQ